MPWARKDEAREKAICAAYLSGLTLVVIGSDYGISRERVRQILKRNNITSANSPIKDYRAEKKKIERLEIIRCRFKRQCEIIKSYGCRRLIIREMRLKFKESGIGNAPFEAYAQQRHNAIYRDIPWHITFPEWWNIWERSGKWAIRGRELGNYVMGRINDLGPYQKDNIRIITHSQNISDGHARKMESGVANG